jgi:hypothetical protein
MGLDGIPTTLTVTVSLVQDYEAITKCAFSKALCSDVI